MIDASCETWFDTNVVVSRHRDILSDIACAWNEKTMGRISVEVNSLEIAVVLISD